jgi:hypothetical protein
VVAQFFWSIANYGNRLTLKIHEQLIQMSAIYATAGNLYVETQRRERSVEAIGG